MYLSKGRSLEQLEELFPLFWLSYAVFDLCTYKFQWGQNLELMHDLVLKYPDRVQNLYFSFLFVLRAVTKVSIFSATLFASVRHIQFS